MMARVKMVDGKYVVVGRLNRATPLAEPQQNLKDRLRALRKEQYETLKEIEGRDPRMARSARKLLGATRV